MRVIARFWIWFFFERHQLRFGALLLTRAQEARRLLAERREIVEELERAKRDHLGGAKGPSV